MSNYPLIKASLLGSSSALGLNWIYDSKLLLEHSKNNRMIFEAIDHKLYKSAKTSYDVYPNHQVGDLDFLGEVLYLFHMYHEYEKELSLPRWRKVFYEYFREDYEYDGYIESYGKDFLKRYKLENTTDLSEDIFTDYIDKELIGLIFILGLHDSDRSTDKITDALNYAKTLTSFSNIEGLTIMLNNLLMELDNGTEKLSALKKVIADAPMEYHEALYKSLTDIDSRSFVETYSGLGCGIKMSLPLIFFVVAHSKNWEDALKLNTTLGGASSARGIFISALFSKISSIPLDYSNKLKYNI